MEIWKNIEGYNSVYQVSNYGRVKSYGKGLRREKILKPSKDRYCRVVLCKKGKIKGFSVHRLVALAFLDNHRGCEVVNHIDFDRHNNRVENLEWCTQKENIQHSKAAGHHKPYWTGKKRSEETKRRMSAARKGKPSNRKDYKVSEETKRKISETLKKRYKLNFKK